MRLKIVEPDSCDNCKYIIKANNVAYDWYCDFHKECLPVSIIIANKIICEDGYEDDGSRIIK